jgi:NIPSNAP protein
MEDRMFVEQRLYTCAPGNTAQFLKLYEAEGRAPQVEHQGQPIGYYVSEIGPLNQITTLWAYASLDERVERRRALFADARWNGHLGKARPLLTNQETRILLPAPFFKERLAAIAGLGRAQ